MRRAALILILCMISLSGWSQSLPVGPLAGPLMGEMPIEDMTPRLLSYESFVRPLLKLPFELPKVVAVIPKVSVSVEPILDLCTISPEYCADTQETSPHYTEVETDQSLPPLPIPVPVPWFPKFIPPPMAPTCQQYVSGCN
jgi:hypothetical protein